MLMDTLKYLISSQDDDELERKLNGPGAIAAAAAARVAAPPTSSSARRRPRPGTEMAAPATSRRQATKTSALGRARAIALEPNTGTEREGFGNILDVDGSSVGLPNGALCDSAGMGNIGRGGGKTVGGSSGGLHLDSFSAGVEESLPRDVSFVLHAVENYARCFGPAGCSGSALEASTVSFHLALMDETTPSIACYFI